MIYLAVRSDWEPGWSLSEDTNTTGSSVLGQVGPVLHQVPGSQPLLIREARSLLIYKESQVVPVSRSVFRLSSEE